jgi:hypothetical protein
MAEYREQHPEASEYSLGTEEEAESLLLAIADQVRLNIPLLSRPNDRRHLAAIERSYRLAVAEGRALKFIASMNEESQLEIYGLRIVVPAVIVTQ